MQPPIPRITIVEVAYTRSKQTGREYSECLKEVAKEKMRADVVVLVIIAFIVAFIKFG